MKSSSHHPYPRVGVATFVMKDDHFLIGWRYGSAHGNNTWGLPGGKLEMGESFEDCSRREIAEEVGVEVDTIRFLAATNDLFEADNLHYVTIFMIADWTAGEPHVLEPQKCREWRWVRYNELPENVLLPMQNLKKQYPKLKLR